MQLELKPGEAITVVFHETDGAFTVAFQEDAIVIKDEDSKIIYRESFENPPGVIGEPM